MQFWGHHLSQSVGHRSAGLMDQMDPNPIM